MVRKLIIIFILVSIGIYAKGVPAYPNRVKVTTENGDTVEITVKGDEFQKYAISEDGFILSPVNNSWYYLNKTNDSEFTISNIQLKKSLSRSTGVNLVKNDSTFVLPSQKKGINRRNRQAIYGGVSHALVILMEYPDKKFIKSKKEISDLFNKIGYNEDRAQGSVRDFYNYASYGTLDLISDIYGPYITKSTMDFYGGNESNGNDRNAIELALEAIKNLPDNIDLSIYDNNNDGEVDNIHIIFAGYGEESGASSSTIWSHEYPQRLPIKKNGFEFAGYSCTPELRSNMGNGISRIGVICHELGHAFGANDFYDVDYSNNGSYEGTGVWDIMASGSWNNNGICPANFNPYIKIEDFGWVNPIISSVNGNVSLESYNLMPTVLRIPTSDPDEYYLVEYRRGISFDIGLPGEGVLIYHVHPQIENRRGTNTINNSHPQYFYPVCASSEASPFNTHSYGEINSAGCPFPGSTNNTQFNFFSIPCAFQWNGSQPNFSITNIRTSNEIAQFEISFDNQPSSSDPPTESLVYQESFENGFDQFNQEPNKGTVTWSIYPTNSLSTLHELPAPIEGKRALMLCDGNKSVISSKSLLTSKEIVLNSDSTYIMSFWMKANELHSNGFYKFILSIRNPISYNWDTVYEVSESIDEWVKIQIELPHNQSNLYYQFIGEVLNGGIFIDDIQIKSIGAVNTLQLDADNYCLSIINNPFSIMANEHMMVYIHDISGKKIESYSMTPSSIVMPQLSKGMYVILTDKGKSYKVVI